MSTATPDYQAVIEETRRDLRDAKIGLAQWLLVEVIFDYSFRLNQASAWLPSFDLFVLRTGMGKKEIGKTLARLESYGILEWEPAPEAEWPQARRYKLFPRSTRVWSIAPRVPDKRLQERGDKMDRWLRSLNAAGGPAQGDFFPPKWDHADTLAEWQARPQSETTSTPDTGEASSDRAACPRPAAEPSTLSEREPTHGTSSHTDNTRGHSAREKKAVGKFPTHGEKPHSLRDGYGLNERNLSLNPNQGIEWEAVGKFPTRSDEAEAEDAARPPHWPSREVENRLMRRIAELMYAFYASDVAAKNMAKFGGIWRWRIRQYPFAVIGALDKAVREWSEIHKLGGYLDREWGKLWRKRAEKMQASLEERDSEQPADEHAAPTQHPTS